MNPVTEDILMHYGTKRHSGRYPWGSGDDPYQRSRDFLSRVEELQKTGWKETPDNILEEFGLTTTEYRMEKSIAKDRRRMDQVATAKSLKEDGLSITEIGRQMGVRDTTVHSWLNAESESRMKKATETAEFIKKNIEERGMIDVGAGVEFDLNVSKEKLNTALYMLEQEGYPVYGGGIPQLTNAGQQTNQKVICPKGTPPSAIYDYANVHSLKEYISRDGGATYEKKFTYPESLDSKRMQIRYSEDGGLERDGTIELRRGVADLSLGNSRYSQVRIMVDGTHYLKGMAVYSDDMPDGVDVIFNTNKKKGTPPGDVMKKIKDDPDNPFGSLIKDADQGGQYWYDPKTGDRVSAKTPGAKLGLINKRADAGDWTEWKDALPSQFLGKQSLSMAKKQLDLAKSDKLAEFDEICSYNNPTIKKHLLKKFADECDSAAVHLQAAALPGQKYHVIMPINTLKDNEVFAPNYENGTKLALIRYPHGGTFEIPILTVNNKNPLAKKMIGTDSVDAIGINKKNADRLSGADFDGDTAMCIPTHDKKGRVKITNQDPLKDLEGFDPKDKYGADKIVTDDDGTVHAYRNGKEFKVMKNTGTQMGIASNLITDMTLAGAGPDELAKAVKHSMVVIDAEKHKLDYKQSEIDNDIKYLKEKYQDGGGASTILSKAKGEKPVLKRQGTPKTNIPGTKDYDPSKPDGALLWKTADDLTYTVTKTNKRTGEVTTVTKNRTQKSTQMAEADDAYELVSKNAYPMEKVYADYANSMKALANQARMEVVKTGKIEYSKAAETTYRAEVDSLMTKLNTALKNAPLQREALRLANAEVESKKAAYKESHDGKKMPAKDAKKISQQAVSKYRDEVGAVSRKERNIKITDAEWEAIQAGAISESKLNKILANTDVDSLRQRVMPKTSTTLSQAKVNNIKSMSASNYTVEQIASKLGVSTATVSKYLRGKE